MRELIPLFPSINDHNLRKTIKDLGGEPVFYDNKIFNYNKDIVNSEKIYTPLKVFIYTLGIQGETAKRIYCGANYACLITEPEGRIYTWGKYEY